MSTQANAAGWKPARILLPTDGSEYATGAIAVAIELAKRCGAPVRLMTSLPLGSDLETVGTQNLLAAETAKAQAQLDALASTLTAAGVTCDTEVRHDEHPDAGIVDSAAEAGAGLIVMGRRGKRGLARLMVGHATAKVIGNAPCDVLVAPRAAQFWTRRILLATDGSVHSRIALERAGAVAAACGLPVSVLSVVAPSHGQERRAEAQRVVDEALAALRGQGIAAEGGIAEGRPDEVIVAQARSQADLIVVGSHGRTGLLGVLLGSVSERVIGAADCPVLVARPSAA